LQSKLEEATDKVEWFNGKIAKLEAEASDRERVLVGVKQGFEKEISLANEQLYNNGKFIKEAEERHQEEIEYYQRKVQAELAEQAEELGCQHEANLKQNKTIL
jgi:hypothetical protein